MCGICNRGAKYVKQNLIKLKREIDKATIRVGNFNTLLLTITRRIRQKEYRKVDNTISHQGDLNNIYRTHHPTTAAYTFFSSDHGTYIKIEQILGHKENPINLRELKSYRVYSPTTKESN